MNLKESQSKNINATLLAQLSKLYPEELNNADKHSVNHSPEMSPANNIPNIPFSEFIMPISIKRSMTPDSYGPSHDIIKRSITPEVSGYNQAQSFEEIFALKEYSRKRNRTLSSGMVEGLYNQSRFIDYSIPTMNNPPIFSSSTPFLQRSLTADKFCSPLSAPTIPNLFEYARSQPFMANLVQNTYVSQTPDNLAMSSNLFNSDSINMQNLGQYPSPSGSLNYSSPATPFHPSLDFFSYDKPSDDIAKALELKPFDKENILMDDILEESYPARTRSAKSQSIDVLTFESCNAQFEKTSVEQSEPKIRRHSMPDKNVELSTALPRKQMLRFDNDHYTPKLVRFSGCKKEGLCGLCPEGKWLQLKNSAYWYFISLHRYHLQFSHGISSVSGSQFKSPEEIRVLWLLNMTERLSMQTLPANILIEGLCHNCNEWKPLNRNKKKYSWNYNSMDEVKNAILTTGTLLPNSESDQASTLKIIASFDGNQDMNVPVGMDISHRVLNEIKENMNSSGSSTWWKHCHKCHLSSSTTTQ
jgi:hypothetical protein